MLLKTPQKSFFLFEKVKPLILQLMFRTEVERFFFGGFLLRRDYKTTKGKKYRRGTEQKRETPNDFCSEF